MSPEPPHPCCIPSNARLRQLRASIDMSNKRRLVVSGSLQDMVRLEGGSFRMGSGAPEAAPQDGEGPVRLVTLAPFFISKYAVTNAQFGEFVRRTEYRTEAERYGDSFVFRNHVRAELRGPARADTPWWVTVRGADWAHPEGPDSSIADRPHHPVLHV